ncbi:carbamoyl-phosphate synthase (glutamine-hydrolyzing) large subunit [Terribacillus sp. DMT04]|uniref:carbamoyl-phosphate synthase (glutamine-hydrolyzing) large subunit n=1 Tax=Terribacillus sp. DMT04 TaxID=2850441 RepID=UPI001C2C9678|nr:carbamoyl-phosphate synthase (glutamine-hydrolyzing) large subunit [Terribacillus sp. DMT04]QXE02179.1 carbamoyl-phosphate synthase (glutamine-hydrolyzing) large subunit [Terribacillus sp. DMT04]
MPKDPQIKKVLVIGSGPIVIGQAAEFDYAGTQACLALKEEGVEVILVNNNPATIMTDQAFADQVYLEPLTCESVTNIIEKERPDGLLPTLGGQTGLNLAVSLDQAGVLQQYNVTLLGTPLDAIQRGEDRELFKQMMQDINEPVPESLPITSIAEAKAFAEQTGFPIIIRPAYTLGGAGGGIANDLTELLRYVKSGIQASPINQVLIEQSVKGWKEIEYEVMRDSNDTCIIVCNMENIDPVGIHTGDSIVVAPSQTLTDRQYQMLRTVSCKVIRELGVVGGCNIQFALNPDSDEYVIIEVNPRVSRSSALASKATGYPIARIAAKLALGYHLHEVPNPITGDTFASFEPAIDYVAVKIPRWPFDKFTQADRLLGTQMKATGEVMALSRNLPAGLNKAIRSLEIGLEEFRLPSAEALSDAELEHGLKAADDRRLFLLAEAFRRGISIETIHEWTEITTFFLHEMKRIIDVEQALRNEGWQPDPQLLRHAKILGFSNVALARIVEQPLAAVEGLIKEQELKPSYMMVDTCAAEFSAQTPYFYSSWTEEDEVDPLPAADKKVVVLGSGPIRIGQGVEFDFCSVQSALSLREQGIRSIVINNNPETVSTDFNTADHLYFEPLTKEDVLHIIEKEQADEVLVQFGGQTAINLAAELEEAGVTIAGTSTASIDRVENREAFYALLHNLNIPHIPGTTVMDTATLHEEARLIGYPILIRPSYVIGGQGMVILYSEEMLNNYLEDLQQQIHPSRLFPLLLDKYVPGMEVEVDVVCDGADILIPGIYEHIEPAGIHSGDSTAIFPAPSLNETEKKQIVSYAQKISAALNMKGIMNIQFVFSENRELLYVLEVNPRASRTVPISSKVTGIPLVDLATKIQMGESLQNLGYPLGLQKEMPFYAVKLPVFSTTKLAGVDPLLGPDMQSTGEAIGIGETVAEALQKAFGWKEKTLRKLTAETQVLLDLDASDIPKLESLLEQLQTSVVLTHETAALLPGSTAYETVSYEQAITLIEDQKITAVCSTRKGFQGIREAAWKTETPCMTSLATMESYWLASQDNLAACRSMSDYLEQAKKERV